VSNAAEAMPDGGRIDIISENRRLNSPIRGYEEIHPGEYCVLKVSDSGVGIPPEDIHRIFEPFYTKKKMGRSGTGLGMAVIWGTVQDHHGHIDVQSAEGRGTTVELFFPSTQQRRSEEKRESPFDAFRGNGETILIVDDEEEQREIASRVVEQLGYVARSMSCGEAAVEYLKTDQVDLMILDMILGSGIDGLETYKRILQYHPHQKAIITSGFAETARVRNAMKLGVGGYLKKPYTLENIGMAIKSELDRKRAAA
jgi:two-component system, cell cycle sensor histidine kinase and response regulator CckA